MSTSNWAHMDAFITLCDTMRDPGKIQGYLDDSDFKGALAQSLSLAVGGSALFGLWTGLYAMTLPQLIASALKAPILLVGTTLVCFPAFFVVQYVLAPRALSVKAALLLQSSTLGIIGITWAVVALPCSLFIANAQNYVAAKLLVTGVAAFGGLIGLGWFVRGFRRASATETRNGSLSPLLPYCVLFALVGAQMAWGLRPFLGSASEGFVLFRPMGGNLIEHLLSL